MFPPSYFPRWYFPAGYFPGGPGSTPSPGTGTPGSSFGYFPGSYFPGSYFPGSYFPGAGVGTSPSPNYVYDPDFMDGVNARAMILVDRNAAGATRTAHGFARRDLQAVTGLEDVPVILGQLKAAIEDVDGRPQAVQKWQVMFGQPVSLDLNNCLKVEDRDRPGNFRYLWVVGTSSNAFLMDHHWYADLVEYVRPNPV